MNFYWRQTIVGLLRYAAEQHEQLAERSSTAAAELDRNLSTPWLEEAFSVFQEAALLSRNPVFVTGAYYAMRAQEEVRRWEKGAGGPVRMVVTPDGGSYALPGAPDILPGEGEPDSVQADLEDHDISGEAERGILELFERVRRGATLEEALALFPMEGDESSPH